MRTILYISGDLVQLSFIAIMKVPRNTSDNIIDSMKNNKT
jgi:hypothetical protein